MKNKPCRIYMIFLILVYTCLVFFRLGSTKAPKSYLPIRSGGMLEFSFSKQPTYMMYYLGPGADRESSFELLVGDEGVKLTTAEEKLKMEQVFSWQAYLLPEGNWNALALRLLDERAILFELVFLDEKGEVIYPDNATGYEKLFDETALLPQKMSTLTETYFDEIYYARTAFEYLHRLPAYEATHPPLGKILIMCSVALFGMNPFGWRFMNALFGILIIPLIFSFVSKLTKKEWIGAFAATLYTFDFMHFAESRIATLDSFCAFFILLMYERFLAWCIAKNQNASWKQQKKCILGGAIATALAVSTKWTGIFAGFGLFVMFLIIWIRDGLQGHKNQEADKQEFKEQSTKKIKAKKQKSKNKNANTQNQKETVDLRRCILFTILSYAGITAGVYILSYLPHISFTDPDAGFFRKFLLQQKHILTYHTGLSESHLYESGWLEWPLMNRPLLLVGYPDGDCVRTYMSFGNPLIWWGGLAALILVLILSIVDLVKKRDPAFAQKGIFLVISYLAQYLPWAIVSRAAFIYHYFPCVAFLVAAIALLAMRLWDKVGAKKAVAFMVSSAAVSIALFVLYYPVLTGMRVSKTYVHSTLEWGERWDMTGEESTGQNDG